MRVMLVRVVLVRVVGLYMYQAKHIVRNGPNITVLNSSSIRKCFKKLTIRLSIARDSIVLLGIEHLYNLVTTDVLA